MCACVCLCVRVHVRVHACVCSMYNLYLPCKYECLGQIEMTHIIALLAQDSLVCRQVHVYSVIQSSMYLLLHVPHFSIQVTVASFVFIFLCHNTITTNTFLVYDAVIQVMRSTTLLLLEGGQRWKKQ